MPSIVGVGPSSPSPNQPLRMPTNNRRQLERPLSACAQRPCFVQCAHENARYKAGATNSGLNAPLEEGVQAPAQRLGLASDKL